MKKNQLFFGALLISLCSLGFTGCESDSEVTDKVITFEDVNLGGSGYWNGSSLSGTPRSYELWGTMVTEYVGGFQSGILTCRNLYNSTYLSWSDMACSSQTNMDSIGIKNQYSVYSHSGAGGSAKFAVLCPFDSSNCTFSEEINIKSMMINNATYTYWALKEGKDGSGYARKFAAKDSCYLTITGFDANKKITGFVDFYLADFRNGKSYICKDWTRVSLQTLGKIKSLSFKFRSSDSGDWGINTPAYACIDNIVYSE